MHPFRLDIYLAFGKRLNIPFTWGNGYASFPVKLLTLRQSMQIRILPGTVTITIVEEQALSDFTITPNRKIQRGRRGNAVAS